MRVTPGEKASPGSAGVPPALPATPRRPVRASRDAGETPALPGMQVDRRCFGPTAAAVPLGDDGEAVFRPPARRAGRRARDRPGALRGERRDGPDSSAAIPGAMVAPNGTRPAREAPDPVAGRDGDRDDRCPNAGGRRKARRSSSRLAAGGAARAAAGLRLAAAPEGGPQVLLRQPRIPVAAQRRLYGPRDPDLALSDARPRAHGDPGVRLDRARLRPQSRPLDPDRRRPALSPVHAPGAGTPFQVRYALARHRQQGVPVPRPGARQRLLEPRQRRHDLDRLRSRDPVGPMPTACCPTSIRRRIRSISCCCWSR